MSENQIFRYPQSFSRNFWTRTVHGN